MKQNSINNLRVAFLGTPEIAASVLEDLIKVGFDIAAVFCAADKKSGRGKHPTSPASKIIAQKYKIPVFQPVTKEDLFLNLSEITPDLAIAVAYGLILPKKAIDLPKYGILNVHYSLLPRYRGAAPYIASVLNGDKKTGVTIMKMVEKLDEGDIVAQKEVGLNEKETSPLLLERLTKISSKLLIEIIPKWINGEIEATKQKGEATYAPQIKKEDGLIDWTKNAREIERQIRAYTPWPGSYAYWEKDKNKKMIIKIMQAKPSGKKDEARKPGEVFLDNEDLSVQTGNGVLIIEKLQLEGKKEVSSAEFLHGYPNIADAVLS